MNKPTQQEYKSAITRLVSLSNMRCGASRVAAQILLGLYDGDQWHVDLIGLVLLDRNNYQAALTAIQGRIELGIEPHEVIDDGRAIFNRLQIDWYQLNVKNRYLAQAS